MDDFMLLVLSNVGGPVIFLILVVAIFLLLLLLGSVSGKCIYCNNPIIIIPMTLIMVAVITGVIGFCISVDSIDAPVSWFRDLPVGQIDWMKNIMSQHDRPLTIYQFYNAQQNYRDSVERNKHKHAELDAMKGIKK